MSSLFRDLEISDRSMAVSYMLLSFSRDDTPAALASTMLRYNDTGSGSGKELTFS
jgi:hypothetical protein